MGKTSFLGQTSFTAIFSFIKRFPALLLKETFQQCRKFRHLNSRAFLIYNIYQHGWRRDMWTSVWRIIKIQIQNLFPYPQGHYPVYPNIISYSQAQPKCICFVIRFLKCWLVSGRVFSDQLWLYSFKTIHRILGLVWEYQALQLESLCMPSNAFPHTTHPSHPPCNSNALFQYPGNTKACGMSLVLYQFGWHMTNSVSLNNIN